MIELIKNTFPGALDDLKIRGHLPIELTAKEALEHIWKLKRPGPNRFEQPIALLRNRTFTR